MTWGSSLPVAYKGVLVSLNPRKTPCMAKERRTAGAPSALSVKYCVAGTYIGESYAIEERLPLYVGYEIMNMLKIRKKEVDINKVYVR